jgi:hypothetical protein
VLDSGEPPRKQADQEGGHPTTMSLWWRGVKSRPIDQTKEGNGLVHAEGAPRYGPFFPAPQEGVSIMSVENEVGEL